MQMRAPIAVLLLLAALLLLAGPSSAAARTFSQSPTASESGEPAAEHSEDEAHAWSPPIWAVLPFVVMLLCIAIVPLVSHHWWENDKNRGLVSAVLGLPTIAYTLLVAEGGLHKVLHTGEEYVSFIILLGSLFMISGGIVVTGNLKAKPLVNTGFLAVGGLLASLIGTTGAAMLLIRPILSTNSERKHKLHTVLFFIFVVCNCGGCLTPLGDPPLFLGYLKGVPFVWTFGLWPGWALVVGVLLVVYFVFDTIQVRKETLRDLKLDVAHEKALIIRGGHNFLFLGGVVAAVAMTDVFSFPSRELFMVAMALLGWFTTRPTDRDHNKFSFGPIVEVAVVFAGIFSTMIPALALLNARGSEMGLTAASQFFWATGALSSFLDNAPTYVSFLALSDGIQDWVPAYLDSALCFAKGQPAFEGSFAACLAHREGLVAAGVADVYVIPTNILRAISYGAVFMGSMTYIGNGPNFMVRAIANSAGIRMPSFFGYLLWSVAFLVPLFFVVVLVLL